jgi:hypothetical protein
MRLATRLSLTLLACLALIAPTLPRDAYAQLPGPCCLVPENGQGTADQPPVCLVGYTGQMFIIDGLPPGATIEIAATLVGFTGLVQVPGGSLGGMKETWTATLKCSMTGTGALLGFSKIIDIPISIGESHSAARVPLAPVQSFNTDMFAMQGQIPVGDPVFDLLRLTAGTTFGLPSPGHTTFTQDGFAYSVDSFFDITYRIDFVGNPAGPLGGRSGSTTGTSRFVMCHDDTTPARHSTWGAAKAYYR